MSGFFGLSPVMAEMGGNALIEDSIRNGNGSQAKRKIARKLFFRNSVIAC